MSINFKETFMEKNTFAFPTQVELLRINGKMEKTFSPVNKIWTPCNCPHRQVLEIWPCILPEPKPIPMTAPRLLGLLQGAGSSVGSVAEELNT